MWHFVIGLSGKGQKLDLILVLFSSLNDSVSLPLSPYRKIKRL